MTIASVNPATGETLATFEPLSDAELDRKLLAAERAFRSWRREAAGKRAEILRRAAEVFLHRRSELARTATLEMGKLYTAALAEVDKCATCLKWYADEHERLLRPEEVKTDARRSYVRFDPLGPVLAVMPWNFPYWQVIRFAAPALLAGNVGLLKHASNVPQVALQIEKAFQQAGVPEGVFQTLLVEARRVERIVSDDRVVAATLTGSEGAGRSLGAACGKVLKKVVLELGGSDPFLVLPTADLDAAVKVAVQARVQNNGQSCIAAKRFIVQEPVADEFIRRFTERMAALKVGDPMDEKMEMGPMASRQGVEDIERQVFQSVDAGARVLTGGKRLFDRGFYYAPTVLADVPRESPASREETFGPVAAVFRAVDLHEAIAIANDTRFGLGAAAFTNDERDVERLTVELEAGNVFINGMVKSDPRMPFGGIKASGHGRELSHYGMREFMNIKSVWIGDAKSGPRPAQSAVE
jgi:succinate-semialdehyde dehydrogenase/glutarate-semialdehyde dehydrogenase